MAMAFYNDQDYDNALEYFEMVLEDDPHRTENIDSYSNILYIKENHGKLANLA